MSRPWRFRSLGSLALAAACAACGGGGGASKTSSPTAVSAPGNDEPKWSATPTLWPGYQCAPLPSVALTPVLQSGLFGSAAFQLSRDGKIAAASPSSHEIQIWNVKSGSKVMALTSATPFEHVALRPDGQVVATSSEGRLTLRDLAQRTAIDLAGDGASVTSMSWTIDGRKLVVGHANRTDFFDQNGATIGSVAVVGMHGSRDPRGGVSPDGHWLITSDGTVWDLLQSKPAWRASSIPTAPRVNRAAHGSTTATKHGSHAAPPSSAVAPKYAVPVAPVSPSSAVFSEDGTTAVLAFGDRDISVVDAATGAKRWAFVTEGARGPLAVSADGKAVAAYDAGAPGEHHAPQGLALWNDGKRIRMWAGYDANQSVAAAFSPDGTRLAFLARHISEARLHDNEVRVANVSDGSSVSVPNAKSMPLSLYGDLRIDSPAWSNDGGFLIQGGVGGLYVWNAVTGSRRIVGEGASDVRITGDRDVAFAADDSAFALISEQGDRQSYRGIASIR